MSNRSRREHKPTAKYLNYYSEVFNSPNAEIRGSYFSESEKRYKALSSIRSKPMSSLIKRPSKICGRRRLTTDEVELLYEDDCVSSPESMKKNFRSTETSPEIRRSSRKQKPNVKLQEYIQPSLSNMHQTGSSSAATPTISEKNDGDMNASHEAFTPSTPKKKKEKNDCKSKKRSPIKYYFDGFDNHVEPPTRSLSIGIVDCFEGLTRDLAKSYPITSVQVDTPTVNQSDKHLISEDDAENKLESETLNKKLGVKRPRNDSYLTDFSKRKRFKPSTVRNLTKTKKSTRVTTVVETVDLRSNKRKKTVTKNKKLKVTKHYPLKETLQNVTTDTKTESQPSKDTVGRMPLRNSSLTEKYFKKQESDKQASDIKETLRKFLIMGTKVANAISETLKHNEEALLSKSSAFEKKCLSLVHALAQQGSDLEEDDMEKVLKLLDEEQEERRAYRQTFLESLRVSHLTNMALYSQMLRLLKTL